MGQYDRNSDPEIEAILAAQRNKGGASCAGVIVAVFLGFSLLLLLLLLALGNMHGGWL